MRIVMLNEGTYPYYKGGVSTWTHLLISNLKEFSFITVALTTKPLLKTLYPKSPEPEICDEYTSLGDGAFGRASKRVHD